MRAHRIGDRLRRGVLGGMRFFPTARIVMRPMDPRDIGNSVPLTLLCLSFLKERGRSSGLVVSVVVDFVFSDG
jgi:hypothetical protein